MAGRFPFLYHLLAAMVDNRVHFDGACGLIDCLMITWKRVMTMPGLPKVPSAEAIDITDQGEIFGLS